jgi:photosystem II stability/assembly factor-like uncharacterized protein
MVKARLRICHLAVFLILLAMGVQTVRAESPWRPHDDLFSVSFSTEAKGWACGRWGTILHTSDGGKTWAAQHSGTDFTLTGIYFVNEVLGWAVGAEGTILHTGDGGRTWEKQKSPVPFYHGDVHFVSPLKGWIASEETHILHTRDGGKSWSVQFQDNIFRLKAISFADEQHGWAVGEYGFTYGTRDGGETWTHQYGLYEYCEEIGDYKCGIFLFDVKAIDPQTAVAVGADSLIIMTRDGGSTWRKLDAPVPSYTPFLGVAANAGGDIAICGKGVYLFSNDWGASWSPLRFVPTMEYGWLYSIEGVGDNRFAAVGVDGLIYMGSPSENLQQAIYNERKE